MAAFSRQVAPGSATPVAGSHGYYTSDDGVFSAGLWTCTAHETVTNPYPVHEFIYLLEGSIILTVEGEEHVGLAFTVPHFQGRSLTWCLCC